MRVSDAAVSSAITNDLSRSFQRLAKYQKDLSTGTKLHDPSDNPAGAARALNLRSDIRNLEQYKRNIGEGLANLNFTDSVLDDLVNTMIKMRGLAIQGASDTVNPQDRKILAQEVNEMIEHVASLSQAKFRGKFIFAGSETLEKPYTELRDANGDITSVGNSIRASRNVSDTTVAVGTALGLPIQSSGTVTIGDQTVSIDLAVDSLDDIRANIEAAAPTGVTVTIEESVSNSVSLFRLRIDGTTTLADDSDVLASMGIGSVETTGQILREVDDGIHVGVNLQGQQLFEGAQNSFQAIIDLRDSLRDNDIDGIRRSMTDIEIAREKVSDARGVMGARTRRIELSETLLDRFRVDFTDALANTQDADISATILNLQEAQNVFQSALVSGQTVVQPTLLEFLR